MHFGTITILSIFALFILFQQYSAILISILMMGFYRIVVQSEKFPRLEKFFNDAF